MGDPSDTERTIHDIDSMDMWPFLTGENSSSPREFLPTTVDSIIWKSQYKLITSADATHDYTQNASQLPANLTCSPEAPCLFDLLQDPAEQQNIQAQHPEIV